MSNFFEIIKGNQPVLVDFFADWCGPCKMITPILKDVKKELGDKVKIIKIDVDKNQRLATSFSVKGVPTLVLYKKGNIVWRQAGVVPKQDIILKIKEYL